MCPHGSWKSPSQNSASLSEGSSAEAVVMPVNLLLSDSGSRPVVVPYHSSITNVVTVVANALPSALTDPYLFYQVSGIVPLKSLGGLPIHEYMQLNRSYQAGGGDFSL